MKTSVTVVHSSGSVSSQRYHWHFKSNEVLGSNELM